MNDLEKAIEILKTSDKTLVLVKGDEVITFDARGVKPLLELIDSGKDYQEYSFADKVIGRASAFLYLVLGANDIYTNIISKGALNLLENKVNLKCEKVVENIINRKGDDICPMEKATTGIECKEEALIAIRKRLEELKK
jgi:hypothetical protein